MLKNTYQDVYYSDAPRIPPAAKVDVINKKNILKAIQLIGCEAGG